MIIPQIIRKQSKYYNQSRQQKSKEIQQEPMIQARDKFIRSIRQAQMNKIIEQERAQLNENHKKQLHDDFMRHFPQVTSESYQKHKSVLATVVWNQMYSYQILCISDIVCWYLIDHNCYDKDSIKILKFISEYQEIQAPQNQAMAQALINIIKSDQKEQKIRFDGFVIVANLASTRRNRTLIGRIVQVGFLETVSQLLQTKIVNNKQSHEDLLILSSQIMCYMLSSHPPLQQRSFSYLCDLIANICQQVPLSVWSLFSSLSQFRQSSYTQHTGHKKDKKLSKILYNKFLNIILKYRHGQQLQIMKFLIYLVQSQLNPDNEKILQIVKQSGQGKNGTAAQKSALQLGKMYIQKQWIDQIWECDTLWKIISRSNGLNNKNENVFELILEFDDQEILESLCIHEDRSKILEILIQCAEVREVQDQVCQILLILLESQQFLAQLQSLGLERVMNKIYSEKNGQNCHLVQQVLDKLLRQTKRV